MTNSGSSSKCNNWLLVLTAVPLVAFAFIRAYFYDKSNNALVFAEVAAAYVVIQTAIESARFNNEKSRAYAAYILKIASAVIGVLAVYTAHG